MKSCAFCGDPIPRVTSTGRRIKPGAYAKRRFCGQRCAGLAGPPPPPTRGAGRSHPTGTTVTELFPVVLEKYEGIPLTADDVAGELRVKRRTVQTAATRLVREGRISRERDPNGRATLYRVAPEGVRA